MGDWMIVQFAEEPDLSTRKAIIRWAEESLPGKFMPTHGQDILGRRCFGFAFQRADDARRFRERWLKSAA